MLKLVYCKDGSSYGDFDLEDNADVIIDAYKMFKSMQPIFVHEVSTGNIIRMFMLKVARKEFDYKDICIEYNGEVVNILENGQLEKRLGDGFIDVDYRMTVELCELM